MSSMPGAEGQDHHGDTNTWGCPGLPLPGLSTAERLGGLINAAG